MKPITPLFLVLCCASVFGLGAETPVAGAAGADEQAAY
jgi:hypothetical protein